MFRRTFHFIGIIFKNKIVRTCEVGPFMPKIINNGWCTIAVFNREEREVRDAAKEQEEILQYTIALEQEKVKQMAVADSRVKLEQVTN